MTLREKLKTKIKSATKLGLVGLVLAGASLGLSRKAIADEISYNQGMIAFQSNRDNNVDIFAMKPDGSNLTNITNDPETSCEPDISKDCKKVIYYIGVGSHKVVDIDGSNPINISGGGVSPEFSPDGTKIATSGGIINLDGSLYKAFSGSFPTWNPRGKEILYCDGSYDLYVLNIETDAIRQLTSTPSYIDGPSRWSPDGKKIVWGSNKTGNYDIWIMNNDGSNPINLTSDWTSDEEYPCFSPDGNYIAFNSNNSGNIDIWIMNNDGTGRLNLTNDTYTDICPDWESIPGDANGDGKIDGADLAIWQSNYDPLGLNQNTFGKGDWNYDGIIDGRDLALWQQNYNAIGLASQIPEPSTLTLLGTGLIGTAGLFRRKRMKE